MESRPAPGPGSHYRTSQGSGSQALWPGRPWPPWSDLTSHHLPRAKDVTVTPLRLLGNDGSSLSLESLGNFLFVLNYGDKKQCQSFLSPVCSWFVCREERGRGIGGLYRPASPSAVGWGVLGHWALPSVGGRGLGVTGVARGGTWPFLRLANACWGFKRNCRQAASSVEDST